MQLISPRGVRISVRDEKGERLIREEGYRRVEEPSPAPSTPPARKSRKKT